MTPNCGRDIKDKNRSAIKCQLALESQPGRPLLEREWGRYKYTVLAHSPGEYLAIRSLLKETGPVPVRQFYDQVNRALARDVTVGQAENAALHVWGYFSNTATDDEKLVFLRLLDRFRKGAGSLQAVKTHLKRLSEKYAQPYLSDSYYFDFD